MPTAANAPRRFRTLNARNFLTRLPELFQQNHLVNPKTRSMEGFAYETFGAEVEFVRDLALKNRGRSWWICKDYHYVNRFFYLVAKEGVTLPDFTDFRY